MNMDEFERMSRKSYDNTPTWSFCIEPDPDYDEEAEEKQHHAEMIKEAHDSWNSLIKDDYPNELFPEFLWTPQINDYGDDFAYLNTKVRERNSIFFRAGSLHRVYSDYFDWIDAMAVWHEYISYINANYGGFEAFADGVEAGYFDGVVAAEPKLKKFPGSKEMMRIKVAVSRPSTEDMAWDEINEIMKDIPTAQFTEEDFLDSPRKDRDFERIDSLLIKEQMREWRINSVLNRNRGGNAMMDSIIDFISNGDSSRTQKHYSGLGGSFTDEMESLYDREITNPEMYDEEIDKLARRGVFYDDQNGIFEQGESKSEEEFITAMLDAGYDINGILKTSGLTRTARKMIQRASQEQYGDYSPKELKKMRKKQEKEARRRKEQFAADERIQSILFDNRFQVGRTGSDGSIGFTLDDIM